MDRSEWGVPDVDSTVGSMSADYSTGLSTAAGEVDHFASLNQYPIAHLTPDSAGQIHSTDPIGLNRNTDVLVEVSPHDILDYIPGDKSESSSDIKKLDLQEAAHNVSQSALQDALVELSVEETGEVKDVIAEVSADFIRGEMSLSQHAVNDNEGSEKSNEDGTRRILFDQPSGDGRYSVGTVSTISDFTDNNEPLTTSHLLSCNTATEPLLGENGKKLDSTVISDRDMVMSFPRKEGKDLHQMSSAESVQRSSIGSTIGTVSDSIFHNPHHPIVHSTPLTVRHVQMIVEHQDSIKTEKVGSSGFKSEEVKETRNSWGPHNEKILPEINESRRISDPSDYHYKYRITDLNQHQEFDTHLNKGVGSDDKDKNKSGSPNYMSVEERHKLLLYEKSGDALQNLKEFIQDQPMFDSAGLAHIETKTTQFSNKETIQDIGNEKMNEADDMLSSGRGSVISENELERMSALTRGDQQMSTFTDNVYGCPDTSDTADKSISRIPAGKMANKIYLSSEAAEVNSLDVRDTRFDMLHCKGEVDEHSGKENKEFESVLDKMKKSNLDIENKDADPDTVIIPERVKQEAAKKGIPPAASGEKQGHYIDTMIKEQCDRGSFSSYNKATHGKSPVEEWLSKTPENMQDYGEISDTQSELSIGIPVMTGTLTALSDKASTCSLDPVRERAGYPVDSYDKPLSSDVQIKNEPSLPVHPNLSSEAEKFPSEVDLVSMETVSTIYHDLPPHVSSAQNLFEKLGHGMDLVDSSKIHQHTNEEVSISEDVEDILRRYNIVQDDADDISLREFQAQNDTGKANVNLVSSVHGRVSVEKPADLDSRSDVNDSGLKSLSIPLESDTASDCIAASSEVRAHSVIDSEKSDGESICKADSDTSNVDSLSQRVCDLLSATSILENKAPHITEQGQLNYNSLQRDLDEIQKNLQENSNQSHDTSLITPREGESELDRSRRLYWDHGADLEYQENGNFTGKMHEVNQTDPDGVRVRSTTSIQPLLTSSIVPVDVAMDLLLNHGMKDKRPADGRGGTDPAELNDKVDSESRVLFNAFKIYKDNSYCSDREKGLNSSSCSRVIPGEMPQSHQVETSYDMEGVGRGVSIPLSVLCDSDDSDLDSSRISRHIPKFQFNSDESLVRKVNELLMDTPAGTTDMHASKDKIDKYTASHNDGSYLEYNKYNIRRTTTPDEEIVTSSLLPDKLNYNTSVNAGSSSNQSLCSSFLVSPIPKRPLSTLSQARTFLTSQLAKASHLDFNKSIELHSPVLRHLSENRFANGSISFDMKIMDLIPKAREAGKDAEISSIGNGDYPATLTPNYTGSRGDLRPHDFSDKLKSSHNFNNRNMDLSRPRTDKPPLPVGDRGKELASYERRNQDKITSTQICPDQKVRENLTVNKPISHYEVDKFRSNQSSNLRPFKRPGVDEVYYVDSGQEDAMSVAPSDATVESSHPGSDDAQPPAFPSYYLGSRKDPPKNSLGIYSKTSSCPTARPPSPTYLKTIPENSTQVEKNASGDDLKMSLTAGCSITQGRVDEADVGITTYIQSEEQVLKENTTRNVSVGQLNLSSRNLKDSYELAINRLKNKENQQDASGYSQLSGYEVNVLPVDGIQKHSYEMTSVNYQHQSSYVSDTSSSHSSDRNPDISVQQKPLSPSYTSSWKTELSPSDHEQISGPRLSEQFFPLPLDEDSNGSLTSYSIYSYDKRSSHLMNSYSPLQLQPASGGGKQVTFHSESLRKEKTQSSLSSSPNRNISQQFSTPKSEVQLENTETSPHETRGELTDRVVLQTGNNDVHDLLVTEEKKGLSVTDLSTLHDSGQRKSYLESQKSTHGDQSRVRKPRSQRNTPPAKVNKQSEVVVLPDNSISSSSDEPPPRDTVKLLRNMMQMEGSGLSSSKNLNELWDRFQQMNCSVSNSDASSTSVNLLKLSSLLHNPVGHISRKQYKMKQQETTVGSVTKESKYMVEQTLKTGRQSTSGAKSDGQGKTNGESSKQQDSSERNNDNGKKDENEGKDGSNNMRSSGDGDGNGEKDRRDKKEGEKDDKDDKDAKDNSNREKNEKRAREKRDEKRDSLEPYRALSSTPTPPQTDSDVSTVTPDITPRAQLLPRFGKEETLTSIPENTTLDSLTSITSQVTSSSEFDFKRQQTTDPKLLKLQKRILRQKQKYEGEKLREQKRKVKIQKLEQMLKENAAVSKNTIEFESTSSSSTTTTSTETLGITANYADLGSTQLPGEDSQVTVSSDSTLEDYRHNEIKMHQKRLAAQKKLHELQKQKTERNIRQRSKKLKLEEPSFRLQEVKYSSKTSKQKDTDNRLKEKDKRNEEVIKEVHKDKSSYSELKKPVDPPPRKAKPEKKRELSAQQRPNTHDVAQNFPSPVVSSPPTVRKVKEVVMVSKAIQTLPFSSEIKIVHDSVSYVSAPIQPSSVIQKNSSENDITKDKPPMFTPESPSLSGQEEKAPKSLTAKIGLNGLAWCIPVGNELPWRQPLKERQAYAIKQDMWSPTFPVSLSMGVENIPHHEAEIYFTKKINGQEEDIEGQLKVSLQDAFKQRQASFISRSRERVKKLKLNAEQRQMDDHLSSQRDELFRSEKKIHANPNAHPLSEHHHKPTKRLIGKKEMIEHTSKVYNMLPEVVQKAENMKRQRAYQTNRLRAAIYKKKLQEKAINKRGAWIDG